MDTRTGATTAKPYPLHKGATRHAACASANTRSPDCQAASTSSSPFGRSLPLLQGTAMTQGPSSEEERGACTNLRLSTIGGVDDASHDAYYVGRQRGRPPGGMFG